MVETQFGALLKEFEAVLGCPLSPDENNSCLITFEGGAAIQIEMDRHGMVVIGYRLGAVHMGKYRENLIRQALKMNELDPFSKGSFGFSQRSNQIILFTKINPLQLNAHRLSTFLPDFVAKGRSWQEAIAKGELPTIDLPSKPTGPTGIFSLI